MKLLVVNVWTVGLNETQDTKFVSFLMWNTWRYF